MQIFQFIKSYVSVAGDYYQITFDNDSEAPDDPYFMIQCDFEFPGKECYFESDKQSMIGHYLVNSVEIQQGALTIRYGPLDKFVVRVEYQATDQEQNELISAAKVMFDNVNVTG